LKTLLWPNPKNRQTLGNVHDVNITSEVVYVLLLVLFEV